MKPPALDRLLDTIRTALADGSFVKLTLSAPRADDRSLRNVQVRSIDLRGEPHLSFVYHHATRDITRNFPRDEGLSLLGEIIGTDFRNAHLFTTQKAVQLEMRDGHGARLREGPSRHEAAPPPRHDVPRQRRVDPAAPWLQALGVTGPDGRVARGMEAKFRQIDKFTEIVERLIAEAGLLTDSARDPARPIHVADMGCGKGYLTFALADWLRRAAPTGGVRARVRGIEARPELVALGNRIARELQLDSPAFEAGTIAAADLSNLDLLIALHACDTATDDALARGIAAGARLIIVSPCCQKELRPQLVAPPPLAGALRHGIFRERQAEFVTDALRAALLEWAGYDTRVFEFIATEHTAKNLMITAVRRAPAGSMPDAESAARAGAVRDLARHYGIRRQHLATALNFSLESESPSTAP